MQYIILFLEGLITFISPCLLPMLPIYVSYFAGHGSEPSSRKTLRNALGFVCGFTVLFLLLGAFAGTVGSFLKQHHTIFNFICGALIILFGLNFMEVIHLPWMNRSYGGRIQSKPLGFWSAALFGILFSISWTPCIGTFLGTALLTAATSGETLHGILMLLCFSAGLGLPFLLSAVLIAQLKSTFDWVKRHYTLINRISGIFLIIVGVFIMTGSFGYFLSWLTIR
mgnify:CR=1 FL=1